MEAGDEVVVETFVLDEDAFVVVVEALVLDEDAFVLVLVELLEEDELTIDPELKVEPIGPNLMLENVTESLG